VRRVKLIVGLGNPGIEYQFTPHNMGYLAVDRIAEKLGGIRIGNRHCRALTGRAPGERSLGMKTLCWQSQRPS